ncbi:hypothetical protein GJ496_005746 [Pomphorhynchus laevis]|nr:hypothetical protein GJ496_005746 [Pomphorhynchus laevis]
MFNLVKSQNGADTQPAGDAVTLHRVLDRRLRQLWASLPHANAGLSNDATSIDIQPGSYPVCTLDAVAAAAASCAPILNCDLITPEFTENEDIKSIKNEKVQPLAVEYQQHPNSSKVVYSMQTFASPHSKKPSQQVVGDENRIVLENQLQELYSAVRSYKAENSNQLMCADFINLPPKAGYPDYYEIIKKPIDMTKIQLKITSGSYNSLDALIADFAHLFHNACIYNEPTSKIYSYALTLHRIMMTAAANITKPFQDPLIQDQVQQILQCLFQAISLAEDEDGRRYSDTFHESFSSVINHDGEYTLPLKFIEMNLKKRRYHRLDVFQDHFVQLCDHARNVASADMQIFEDSILLQTHFFKVRDDLCENGDRLASSAKTFALRQFLFDMDAVQAHKSLMIGDEPLSCSFKLPPLVVSKEEFHILEAQTSLGILRIGYFVKLKETAKVFSPIVCIGGFRQLDDSVLEIFPAIHFVQPCQISYSPAHRFLKKEIFLCEVEDAVPIDCVECICHVAYIKDFKSNLYKGIPEENIFVCESFYHTTKKQFRKLKVWQSSTYYDELLCTPVHPPARLERYFLKEDPNPLNERNWPTSVIHKQPEEIPCENEGSDGNRNFEQVFVNQEYYKLGDFVRFKHPDCSEPFVLEVSTIWKDTSGNCFTKGPYYVPTVYVPHEPTRLFYRNEILRYDTESITVNFNDVIDKCAILDMKKYSHSRPTEIIESNVFICDFKYFPEDKTIRRLRRTLKRPRVGLKVTEDEILYLKKEICPPKVASPHLLRAEADPSLDIGYNGQASHHDDNKGNPVQLDINSATADGTLMSGSKFIQNNRSLQNSCENSLFLGTDADANALTSPVWLSRQRGFKAARVKSKKSNRSPCGYLLYADEIRRQMLTEYPGANYSALSRKIGEQWRNLTEEERAVFEEKAKLPQHVQANTFMGPVIDHNDQLNNVVSSQNDTMNYEGFMPINSFNAASSPVNRKSNHSQLLQRLQSNHTDQMNFSPAAGRSAYSNQPANSLIHSSGVLVDIPSASGVVLDSAQRLQNSIAVSTGACIGGAGGGFNFSNRPNMISRFPSAYNNVAMMSTNAVSPNVVNNAMIVQRPASCSQQPQLYLACPQSLFNSGVNNQTQTSMSTSNRFNSTASAATHIPCTANRDGSTNLLVNLLSANQVNNNFADYQDSSTSHRQMTPNAFGRFTQSKYSEGPLIEIQSPGLRPQRPSLYQNQYISCNNAYSVNNAERKRNHLNIYNKYLKGISNTAKPSKYLSNWQQKINLIETAKQDVAKELSENKDCVSSIEEIHDLYAEKFKALLKNNSEQRNAMYKWFSYIKPDEVGNLASALSKLSKRLILQSVKISSSMKSTKDNRINDIDILLNDGDNVVDCSNTEDSFIVPMDVDESTCTAASPIDTPVPESALTGAKGVIIGDKSERGIDNKGMNSLISEQTTLVDKAPCISKAFAPSTSESTFDDQQLYADIDIVLSKIISEIESCCRHNSGGVADISME